MSRHFISAEYKSEMFTFNKLGLDDPLVSASGEKRIGHHEGCGGDIIALLKGNRISIFCNKFVPCGFRKLVPSNIDTLRKLTLFLKNVQFFPCSLRER